jgi:RNA polymerase sigma-70 factor (ECF subfamily)
MQAANQRDVALAEVPLDAAWMSPGETDLFAETYTAVQREQVRACMRQLPREQRSAIERAYFTGESFAAIAREMRVPVGTVKSRVRLGMCKLRRMLAPVA